MSARRWGKLRGFGLGGISFLLGIRRPFVAYVLHLAVAH